MEKSELQLLGRLRLHGAQTEDNYYSRLADIYLSADGKKIARSNMAGVRKWNRRKLVAGRKRKIRKEAEMR